jgi:molybdate transport system substrate-binding protein
MKVVGLVLTLLLGLGSMTHAADLQVLAGGGIAGPLKILAPQFETATGNKLVLRFAATPELIKMATSGDPFDLVVVPREVFADAGAKGRLVLESSADVARVGFGVGVRTGTPKPDIGTPEAFKQTLLKAQSVATVPASAAGAVVLKTFDRLGIAEAMKAKIKPQATPADIPLAVTNREAELGVFLLNVLAVPGVDVVGPFPLDLQQEFVFRSAVAAETRNAVAAKAFIDFLRTPAAVAVFRAQGMTPG